MNIEKNKKLYVLRSKLKARGFTLIEFLVVLGIIVLIVPSLFGLIYSLLRQQGRIVALQEVKRQGDLVFNHMKTTMRNQGGSISSSTSRTGPYTPQCRNAGESFSQNSTNVLYFEDPTNPVLLYFGYRPTVSGAITKIVLETNRAGPPYDLRDLTNSSVTVSNLVIGCTKNSEFAPPLVNISYTVTQPANSVSLNYKTLIKLNAH